VSKYDWHCRNVFGNCIFFSNGIKDAGLYIAMLYNIKKMEVEGVCDVPTSVRMVRNHSQEFRMCEVNIF
jgi:hypothetical protein